MGLVDIIAEVISDIELCPICHGSDVRETKDGKFCNQLCKKLIPESNFGKPIYGSYGGYILSSSANWNDLLRSLPACQSILLWLHFRHFENGYYLNLPYILLKIHFVLALPE